MTIEYEKQDSMFIENLNKIYTSKGLNQQISESLAEIKKRNAEYANLTFELVKECEHANLLNLPDLASKKVNVLCHIADIILRKSLRLGDEKTLTLDDVLCIAIATQIRDIQPRIKVGRPILTFLPDGSKGGLSTEDKLALASRAAEYQMQYVPQHYVNDNTEKLVQVVAANFMNVETTETLAESLGTNASAFGRRVSSFKETDCNMLALTYSNGHPEKTLHSPDAKTYSSRLVTLTSNRVSKPLPLL